MKFNYHTHTTRCCHAQGSDREYVEAAVRGGFRVLGFSDHTPYLFPDGHHSGMRMTLKETEDYFRSLMSLKEEYKDRIEVRIGFEVEYDPKTFHLLKEFLADYPCDYLIEGQNFLNMEKERPYCGARDGGEDLLRAYADRIVEGIESGYFLYTAHPDLPDFRGGLRVYREVMRPVCRAAKKAGSPLEINLLGLMQHRAYPHEEFFCLAAEEGCKAVIGVDAHAPEMLEDTALYQSGVQFAERCGIELVKDLTIGKETS